MCAVVALLLSHPAYTRPRSSLPLIEFVRDRALMGWPPIYTAGAYVFSRDSTSRRGSLHSSLMFKLCSGMCIQSEGLSDSLDTSTARNHPLDIARLPFPGTG